MIRNNPQCGRRTTSGQGVGGAEDKTDRWDFTDRQYPQNRGGPKRIEEPLKDRGQEPDVTFSFQKHMSMDLSSRLSLASSGD